VKRPLRTPGNATRIRDWERDSDPIDTVRKLIGESPKDSQAIKISLIQDQAIAARMALVVGGDNFDRLFRGIQFDEFDGTVLFVYAADEYRAAEIEETFALHISTIAGGILKRTIPVVMVLPQKLKQDRDV
jgi:hypothetical protein